MSGDSPLFVRALQELVAGGVSRADVNAILRGYPAKRRICIPRVSPKVRLHSGCPSGESRVCARVCPLPLLPCAPLCAPFLLRLYPSLHVHAHAHVPFPPQDSARYTACVRAWVKAAVGVSNGTVEYNGSGVCRTWASAAYAGTRTTPRMTGHHRIKHRARTCAVAYYSKWVSGGEKTRGGGEYSTSESDDSSTTLSDSSAYVPISLTDEPDDTALAGIEDLRIATPVLRLPDPDPVSPLLGAALPELDETEPDNGEDLSDLVDWAACGPLGSAYGLETLLAVRYDQNSWSDMLLLEDLRASADADDASSDAEPAPVLDSPPKRARTTRSSAPAPATAAPTRDVRELFDLDYTPPPPGLLRSHVGARWIAPGTSVIAHCKDNESGTTYAVEDTSSADGYTQFAPPKLPSMQAQIRYKRATRGNVACYPYSVGLTGGLSHVVRVAAHLWCRPVDIPTPTMMYHCFFSNGVHAVLLREQAFDPLGKILEYATARFGPVVDA